MKRFSDLEDNLVFLTGIENKDGIDYGEIFYLNYYDTNIFLKVCKTDVNRVCVYELATKKYKAEGELRECLSTGSSTDLSPSRKPLLITENNCPSKSQFWVETEVGAIHVPIPDMCPLYRTKLLQGLHPIKTARAVSLKEEMKVGILNYYWERHDIKKNNVKQEKKNKIKNNA